MTKDVTNYERLLNSITNCERIINLLRDSNANLTNVAAMLEDLKAMKIEVDKMICLALQKS